MLLVAILLAGAGLAQPAFAQSALVQSASGFAADAEQEIVRRVNHERHSRGLPMLVVDERLRQAAREHSVKMAAAREVEHQYRGEPKLELRIGEVRFDASGENVALAPDAAEVHAALMDSPGHRANILDAEYNSIGIGVVRGKDGLFVTEDFARVLPEMSIAEAEDRVAANLNRMRRASGTPMLNRLPGSDLRRQACEMAAHDRVNPRAGLASANASSSVAFTVVDFTQMPASLARLNSRSDKNFAVGACYRTSTTYENPVFWVIVVTYF
jgi:hypothetical protein